VGPIRVDAPTFRFREFDLLLPSGPERFHGVFESVASPAAALHRPGGRCGMKTKPLPSIEHMFIMFGILTVAAPALTKVRAYTEDGGPGGTTTRARRSFARRALKRLRWS